MRNVLPQNLHLHEDINYFRLRCVGDCEQLVRTRPTVRGTDHLRRIESEERGWQLGVATRDGGGNRS